MSFLIKHAVLSYTRSHSLLLAPLTKCNFLAVRGYKRWQRKVFKQLYHRRIEQGPEVERHRSEWLNWNYDSELYAFGKRFGEDFDEQTLRTALTTRCYVEKEEQRRSDLGMEQSLVALSVEHNDQLSAAGEDICYDYIRAYLRHHFPLLPEEGICAISDYLMTDDLLSYIASNLGVKDIVLCSEFPVSNVVLSKTFKAIIGALARHQGKRAQLFIQDFVITQLIGQNLMSLWDVVNPMGVLQDVLQAKGMAEPEPRLLWETGSETVVAAYVVGIYSDKQLVGKSPGETVSIAEEMAARDALQRLFKITDDRSPFTFGQAGHDISINLDALNTGLAALREQQT